MAPSSTSRAWQRGLLRIASWLVPRHGRREWLEAWQAELWHLEHAPEPHAISRTRLALGALPHGLWERKEWTMEVLLQDVRYALRVLARSPGFTALAIVTMALGIGANTTIFTMLNATLLRAPAGIEAPGDVVQIGRDRDDGRFDSLAYPYYRHFRDHAESLQSVAAYSGSGIVIGRGTDLEILNGQVVTGEFFGLLGVEAQIGRVLTPEDDRQPGAHPVAVISGNLWQRRFGGSPDVLGRTIRVNSAELQIVGVAQRGFRGTDVVEAPSDVWFPMMMAGQAISARYMDFDQPGFSWLWTLGRLAPGATPDVARSEVDALYSAAFTEAWGEAPRSPIGVVRGIGLRPDERDFISQLMGLLMLVVAVVLAVACANLANLMLARGIARSQEIGMRVALGAGRVRLIRQLLTESVVIAVGGGVLAGALTIWTARLVPSLLPWQLGVTFAPDWRVFLFALGIGLTTGVFFGLLPALRASRQDVGAAIQSSSPLSGNDAGWLRGSLVVAQLALSFALVATAGLLVQSLLRAQDADPGYNTDDILTISLNLGLAGYEPDAGIDFYERLARRAAALPGVESAALSSSVPFGGWRRQSVAYPQERPELERQFYEMDWATVTPEFFETMEIPLLAGETFSPANASPDMPAALVVSESAAELMWPDQPADQVVGELLPADENRIPEEAFRVIGVAADVQVRSLRQAPQPSVYAAAAQEYEARMSLMVRARGEPTSLVEPLRRLVAELDPDVGVMAVGPLRERMGRSLSDTVTLARLATVFGALALALAAIGLYGVVSYVVSRRVREVGVRMALGATGADVLRLFLLQAVPVAAFGAALGLLLTLGLGRILRGLLYGVSVTDPTTLIAIGAFVTLVSLIATLIPARRASRVDPMQALRSQ